MTPPVNLASRWLGGSVMAASDESFGEKENLLTPGAAAFEPGRYSHRGEIVDGWETRRRRESGHDWALIRLGAPGAVSSIDVDTSFFTGNFPTHCAIEAYGAEGCPSPGELLGAATEWAGLVPRSPLRGDAHNTFDVTDARPPVHPHPALHLPRRRGGEAACPGPGDPGPAGARVTHDRPGQPGVRQHGRRQQRRLLHHRQPAEPSGHGRGPGEGWETRRRRDTGHDYVIFRLAFAGWARQLIVDTAHFRYNAAAEVAAYACAASDPPPAGPPAWKPLLPRTRLQPDTRHVLAVSQPGPVASVRIDAFPDGGLSRVRTPQAPHPQAPHPGPDGA